MTSRSKPSDLLTRMRSTTLGPPATEPDPGEPAETRAEPERPRRARQVRYTTLLDQDLHKSMRRYALDHDLDASQIVRALLQLLFEDPDLEHRVAERIQRQ